MFIQSAFAADTFEQIRERCRESVSPQVQSCMQARKGSGRSRVEPGSVSGGNFKASCSACVQRESQRAAAGKAAPAAPKADAGAPKDAVAIRAVFVAPPRTIADITEILDKEKPDPAKLAKLKGDADKPPPQGVPASHTGTVLLRPRQRARSARPATRKRSPTAESAGGGRGTIPFRRTATHQAVRRPAAFGARRSEARRRYVPADGA